MVKDTNKTKGQLVSELTELHRQFSKSEEAKTGHKQVEDKLKLSAEQFQTLMETAPAIICRSDLRAKILYVNKKFEEVTGYSREEVLGRLWFALGILSVDNVKLLLNRTIEKLKGSPPILVEIQLKRKDGESIWVSLSGTPHSF